MNTGDLAGSMIAAGAEPLHRQLFRYAQDLQELMDQHRRLQQHYEMVLEFLGRDIPDQDILASALIKASELHVVTDANGLISHISPALCGVLGDDGQTLVGTPIGTALGPQKHDVIGQVLEKFAKAADLGGMELRSVSLSSPLPGVPGRVFGLIAMQVNKDGNKQVYWLLEQLSSGDDALGMLTVMANKSGVPTSLIVCDPFGNIHGVNAAFSEITGYAQQDAIGKNPRILGSGRHDNAFFQDFFFTLLDTGSWNGQILNRHSNGRIFLAWQSVKMVEDQDGEVLAFISAMTDLSLREKTASPPHAERANCDPLTGLPNRRGFEIQLNQAMAHATSVGHGLHVLYVDIDGVKGYSDELGYAIGNLARKGIASRLRALESPDASVARLDGDDFVILLRGNHSDAEVEDFANLTLKRLIEPLHVGHHRLHIRADIGSACYPRDGTDMELLLHRSDAAMFCARKFGTHYCLFESEHFPVTESAGPRT